MSFRIAALVTLTFARAATAQAPAGYYMGGGAVLPDSVVEEQIAPGFRIHIARTAASDGDRRLIALAERLFPVRDSIVAAERLERRPLALASLNEMARRPGDRWWWDESDVLTPYAVTATAVIYYATQLRAIAVHPNPYAQYENGAQHHGTFEYTASVLPADSDAPRGTHRVVHLELKWSYGCGSLCALSFSKSRVVFFDAAGRVIAVLGDGPPSIWQS